MPRRRAGESPLSATVCRSSSVQIARPRLMGDILIRAFVDPGMGVSLPGDTISGARAGPGCEGPCRLHPSTPPRRSRSGEKPTQGRVLVRPDTDDVCFEPCAPLGHGATAGDQSLRRTRTGANATGRTSVVTFCDVALL